MPQTVRRPVAGALVLPVLVLAGYPSRFSGTGYSRNSPISIATSSV